jgi:hypothetical protein
MAFSTGDIIINNAGTWGHALMCYEGGSDNKAKFIHATYRTEFAISPYQTEKDGKIGYAFTNNYEHFHPRGLSEATQNKLKAVADKIAARAKYGLYRAVRVALGSSSFGSGAKQRLEKYTSRLEKGGDKLVTTLTCTEAVMLCYQLSLPAADNHFIALDAAHTLPRDLAKYLRSNAQWQATKVA